MRADGAFPFGQPRIAVNAFVADGARIIGDVRIGEQASIWFNCVLRGDVQRIEVGARTNVQDSAIVHGTTGGLPVLIGSDVTIGHGAILHACTIHDLAFVGFGALVLDGAVIETGGMLGAGALLPAGKVVRSGELWVGNPAKFLRNLSDGERANFTISAQRYVTLAGTYASRSRTHPHREDR